MKRETVDFPNTVHEYNRGLSMADRVLTGKEFRRLRRGNNPTLDMTAWEKDLL